MRIFSRLEVLIFTAAFFAYAYFNQGGGWNQNSRFAEVRAIVEEGRFAIDDFFSYRRTPTALLTRVPVINGDIVRHGKTQRLCWVGPRGDLIPINGLAPTAGIEPVSLDEAACSGDVSFARGHFHPNKPPGSTFVAVPAYFLLHKIERLCGRSPDDWRLVVANCWLASAFSVGLISACGCVIFFRLAALFAEGHTRRAFAVTMIFAFGTLFFPFATLLFDHALTATFLLASFYGIFTAEKNAHPLRSLYLSGLAAGLAAITNYVSAVAVVFLGLYLLCKIRHSSFVFRHGSAFAAGLLGPFLAICLYNVNCYGSPFALSNTFQNPTFQETGPTFLGMFGVPHPEYALWLLFSPFRGLFYSAPVLLLGVYGLLHMRKAWRAEGRLFLALCGLFFLINISFFGWHAGFASGPRYLIPALPFLALPMVFGFARFPRAATALAVVSVIANFLFTAVDAESPLGIGSLAIVEGRPMWSYSPLTEYAWPLFTRGRVWPILDPLLETQMQYEADDLRAQNLGADQQRAELAKIRAGLLAGIARGDDDPFPVAALTGPVSVNPMGAYDGGYFHLFGPHSKAAKWASFNAGELLFPHSRWSLLPLLLGEGGLLLCAWRATRRPVNALLNEVNL